MRSPQPINTPFTRRALLGAAPALFLAACSNPSGGQSQSGTTSVTPSVTPTPTPTPVLDTQQLQDLKTQLDQALSGAPLPAHSMLVTALDGTRELYADAPDTPRPACLKYEDSDLFCARTDRAGTHFHNLGGAG